MMSVKREASSRFIGKGRKRKPAPEKEKWESSVSRWAGAGLDGRRRALRRRSNKVARSPCNLKVSFRMRVCVCAHEHIVLEKETRNRHVFQDCKPRRPRTSVCSGSLLG